MTAGVFAALGWVVVILAVLLLGFGVLLGRRGK